MSSPFSTSLSLRSALLLSLAAAVLGPALVWLLAGAWLAAAPETHRAAVLLMVAVQALVVVDERGREQVVAARGFDHFS